MDLLGKIRPQILAAILILGTIAVVAMYEDFNEIAMGCVVGIATLGRELLEKE